MRYDHDALVADFIPALRSHYDACPDLTAGLDWYTRAEDIVRELSVRYQRPVKVVAAVIAVTSPNTPWSTVHGKTPNLDVATTLIAAANDGATVRPLTMGYPANLDKAWSILQGADPDATVSGPKVEAFYLNLLGDPDAPTADLWMARAVGIDPDKLGRNTLGNALRAAIVACAAALGIAVRDFQAAVWVSVRGF